MSDCIKEFELYRSKHNRKDLYKTVVEYFNIRSAIYPGSHIDINPSFIIPYVVYVDNFKGAIKFFKNKEIIEQYIEDNKEYEEISKFIFLGEDYHKIEKVEKVDLIISQYAGFIGQATKKYLKQGGILLCNDSHGDATLAFADKEFEFIGVIEEGNTIKTTNLEHYFKLKSKKKVDISIVTKTMKGPKYQVNASNYLFRKL